MTVRSMAGVDAVLATARREVLVLGSGPLTNVHRADLANLRSGIAYRVVLPTERPARDTIVRLRGFARAGAHLRTVPTTPVDMVVVDRSVAIYPHEEHDVALVSFAGVVTTAVELFERVWATARPLAAPADAALSEQDRAVLTLLSEGYADESMAIQLGISVRTVRRRVSTLMSRLGARSRFQAGVRAACRGWLAAGEPRELAGAVQARAV